LDGGMHVLNLVTTVHLQHLYIPGHRFKQILYTRYIWTIY